MQIARLDNEVFFKKAFTDMIVFKAFVKDILGLEVDPEVIETEKAFQPRLGNINFKYDIFAEDKKKRVIIEIQKVEYDHNFDRFLHYHLQGITEQQRSAEDYTVERTVYTIVVITAPYKINQTTGEIFKDEVLLSKLNPKNLKGVERRIFNHELVFLNPNYKSDDTPLNYRDWLDLIYESIHNPHNPNVNLLNAGVKRATNIVSFEQISPEEWEQSKIQAGRRKVLEIKYEEGLEEGLEKRSIEVAQRAILKGFDNDTISELTGLEIVEIEKLRANGN